MRGAVVDQPQVVVAVRGEQPVDLRDVDQPAEQMRDLAPAVPRRVVLQATRVALEQQAGAPVALDLLVDADALPRQEGAGQPLLLAVEHEHAPAS